MRSLEIILAFLGLILITYLYSPRLLGGKVFVLVLLIFIFSLCVHAVWEGLHWQLIPLYGCLPILVVAFVYQQELPFWLFRCCAIVCTSLLLSACAFSIVLPMFHLPKPTGSYKVGTRILHLVDTSRAEIHSPASSGYRELMVQIWYPAECPCGPLASYRRRIETTLLSSYMSVLRTHSHLDASIAKRGAPFPVLLFNPAWKNSRTQNIFQFEDLASHGYAVASIDHTYNSQPVAFPDGRRITAQDLPEIGDFARLTWQQVEDLGEKELAYQVADDLFVLDALGELSRDSESDFFERLDTENTGVFGHSFGGAVAMESCRKDPRIRAAINMDGWFFGDVAQYGLAKPLFIMSDDSPLPSQEALASSDIARRLRAKWIQRDMQYIAETFEQFGGYSMTILGSSHMVFSDRASYSPFRGLNESGGVDSRLAHQIIESYTLAFFEIPTGGDGFAA